MKFEHEGVEYTTDTFLHCKQIIGEPNYRILTDDLKVAGIVVPKGFKWNGASTPDSIIMRWVAPKFYKNLVASCVHDYLCGEAKSPEDRKEADEVYWLLKKKVECDEGWKCTVSYWGVRAGAYLGIGSDF